MSATGCTVPIVVHQHDGDHGRLGPHRRQHRLGGHAAVRAGRHVIHLPAFLGQPAGRVEHGRVLDRAHDEVAGAREARGADESQGIGLGAAAGEDDLLGLPMQQGRHLRARRGQRSGRRRPRPVQ
jgi:hypothetical protein